MRGSGVRVTLSAPVEKGSSLWLEPFFIYASAKTPRYAGEFKKGEAVVVVIEKLSFALSLKRYCLRQSSKGERQMDASQEHTRWNCRYHIVWAPKFRRKIIYGKYRKEIGAILRKLCDYKGIEIVEANACVDHIHMCLRIPPKYSVAQVQGYLKGKSSLMIFAAPPFCRQGKPTEIFFNRRMA